MAIHDCPSCRFTTDDQEDMDRHTFVHLKTEVMGVEMSKPYPYPTTLEALIGRGETEKEAKEMIKHCIEELEECREINGDPVDVVAESLGLDADYVEELTNDL